jgi:peptidoglycan-N-acetylglucosamine deacetylase
MAFRFNWLRFFFPRLIWQGYKKNALYLTFDDGPHPEVTPRVLEILSLYNIKATFFCVGKNAEEFPNVVKQITAQGHRIGNHTYFHDKGWRTKSAEYLKSIQLANGVLKTPLFRPPYGQIKFSLIPALKTQGMRIIMWSWLSRDYDFKVSNQQIIQSANRIKGGDILVFHDSAKTQHRIELLLHEILPMLLSKQFTFSTFEEHESTQKTK